jgi:hypothetical protein
MIEKDKEVIREEFLCVRVHPAWLNDSLMNPSCR